MKRLLIVFFLLSLIFESNGQNNRKDKFGNLEVIGVGGEILEYHFLDSQGNLRQGSRIAKKKFEYDSLGFLISEKYFDGNGLHYQYRNGVSMIKYIWNNARNILVVENLDSAGKRTIQKEIGASICRYEYDSLMRVKRITYYDTSGYRVKNNESYSKIEFAYTPFAREYYFDENEKLLMVLSDTIKVLRGLKLKDTSVPRLLRKSVRRNLVDGVMYKRFAYSMVLFDQKEEGEINLSVRLVNGDIDSVKLVKSTMSDIKTKKIVGYLNHGYFINLSNNRLSQIDGEIFVSFRKSKSGSL